MCNPLSSIDIYSYNSASIKKAERAYKRKNKREFAKKMVQLYTPMLWDPEPELKQMLSITSTGIDSIRIVDQKEFDNLLDKWLARNNTLYLVQN